MTQWIVVDEAGALDWLGKIGEASGNVAASPQTLVDQSDQNPQCLICAFVTFILRPQPILSTPPIQSH